VNNIVGWLLILLFSIFSFSFTLLIYLLTKRAIKHNKITLFMKLWNKDASKSIASSLISIICGLLIGCFILIIITIIPTKGTSLSFNTAFDGVQLIFG
jgi:hypothetical protein